MEKIAMPTLQNRRRFIAALSSAGATGLLGSSNSSAQEAQPETTTIRLVKNAAICIAPQYVAEQQTSYELAKPHRKIGERCHNGRGYYYEQGGCNK